MSGADWGNFASCVPSFVSCLSGNIRKSRSIYVKTVHEGYTRLRFFAGSATSSVSILHSH
jgi:hypothetical protein